jgi:glyoxylase-like metal-dependent hydrolase (beta-lactamase superfamily II)
MKVMTMTMMATPTARRIGLTIAVAAALGAVAWGQRPPMPTSSERLVKITETIYVGMPTSGADSNGWIFINDADVLVVDNHWTPTRARTLLADIKSITPKPVRYVIDTHYHSDHSMGNQVFPDAQLVGHDYTRRMMLTDILAQETHRYFTVETPARTIDSLTAQVAAERDPARKDQLEGQLAIQEMTRRTHDEEIKEAKPTPPFVTFKDEMTIFRGTREFRLIFLGRAHTGGDIVVYLPGERFVATGDMFGNGVGYMGDAFVNEWPDTLAKLQQLDFDHVLPGHGPAFDGKDRIAPLQAYFRDLWTQASALKRQGVSTADAASRIDLSKHRSPVLSVSATAGVDPKAVERIYRVIDGDLAPK